LPSSAGRRMPRLDPALCSLWRRLRGCCSSMRLCRGRWTRAPDASAPGSRRFLTTGAAF
jgi:hypothetical protein